MKIVSGVEMRAVLDTNVLVSAFKQPPGRVAVLWQAAQDQQYRLLVSPAIAAEVAKILRREFGWDGPRIIHRLKRMTKIGELITPTVALDVIANDPDDNRILECAIAGKADVIVSGDRHLRDLRSYQGIPIVRPVDFRRMLGRS